MFIVNWIRDFQFNSFLGILLYWVPLSFCWVGYTIRTAQNYMKDKSEREKEKYYSPTDTIGTLIGRGIASIVPVVNLWAALFDVAPHIFRKAFQWVETVFNQPLVPKKRKDD